MPTYNWAKGSALTKTEQQYVLSAYQYRFTGDHTPNWATKPMNNGKYPPVQFASDKDWLNNTNFRVTKSGQVHRGNVDCHSSPTWPNNPEHRHVKQTMYYNV